MTDIYIAFDRLPAHQIFHNEGREWVKCESMMRCEDLIFNAFVNIEQAICEGQLTELEVRYFNPNTLVRIDSEQEPITYEILSESVGGNDN